MINKNASKKTTRVIAFKSKVCNYSQTTMISRRKKPRARILLSTIFILLMGTSKVRHSGFFKTEFTLRPIYAVYPAYQLLYELVRNL